MAKKNNLSREESDNRALSAIEQARQKVGASNEEDLSLKPLSWWRERWSEKAIRRKFIETNIKVRDALNENEVVNFKFNDIQDDLWNKLTRKDVVLKMRRGGLSTFFQAIGLADAIIKSGFKARAVPHDPDTESEFRETVKTMFEALPAAKRPPTKYYNERRILFSHKSEYRTQSVQPKREGKGRGLAIQFLHATEVSRWLGNQRQAFTTLLSAAEGGQVYVESTANGLEQFHHIYSDGKRGRAGWKSHFYPWWWRRNCRVDGASIEPLGFYDVFYLVKPGERFSDLTGQKLDDAKLSRREQAVALRIYRHLLRRGYIQKRGNWRDDWHRPEIAEYIAWRRLKIEDSDEKDFLIEYPENDTECFENTGRTVISPKYLKPTCSASGPIENHRYVLAADTSLGNPNGDPAAMEVLDFDTGREVYSETLYLSPDLLAYRLVELSDLYNYAIVAVERNNTGIATVKKLLELVEPERVYKELTRRELRAVEDGRKTYDEAMAEAEFGLATTTANKGLFGVYLEKAIRTGEVGLSSAEWCEQAQTVVWINNDTWAAMPGKHDDKFMALAIANYVRVQALGQFVAFVGVLPEVGNAR